MDGSGEVAIRGPVQFGEVTVAGPESIGASQFRNPGREGVIQQGEPQLQHLNRPGRLKIHADAAAGQQGQSNCAPAKSKAKGLEPGSQGPGNQRSQVQGRRAKGERGLAGG